MSGRRGPELAVAATTGVVLPLIVALIAIPLAIVFWRAIAGGPSLFLDVLATPSSRAAMRNSIVVAGGAAALALGMGAPLAAALARLHLRGGRALATLLVLPLAVPSYVWAMAWIALAAPRSGWLNRAAIALGATSAPFDVFGLGGIIFVEGLALFPLVLLPTRAALLNADPSLEEAARISGAGPLRAFATGSLPMAAPAAASGASLAFLASLSSFGVPYLLGVATEKPALVATTRIYQALSLGSAADVRAALALCLVLLALAGGASLLAARLGRSVPVPAGKGRKVALLDAPRLSSFATVLAWTVTAAAVLLPVGAVLLAALTKRFGDAPGPGNLTLDQFRSVLGKADVRTALANSAVLAAGAALAVVAIGAALAFVRRARPRAWARALLRFSEIPFAVPGTVLALALLLAFSQQIRFILLGRIAFVFVPMGTLWILGIAYVVKYLAFGARSADDAFRAIDPSLEEAARICGAGPGRAFLHATLPLARPQLVAAFVLAFLPAATELTMSVLLAGPSSQVLGTVLFELASYADPPSAAVLACVVLLLAAATDVVLRRLLRVERAP
jgi:iron(III) transport system permease protein